MISTALRPTDDMLNRTCALMFFVAVITLTAQDSGNSGFVPGSGVPLVPMTGDGLQVYSPAYKPNYLRICPQGTKVEDCTHSGAPNNTLTTAGVQGSDEGSSTTSPDGTALFLFGDTNVTWRHEPTGRDIFFNLQFRGPDTIGYYDKESMNKDWSKCRYIENLSDVLSSGGDPKTASADNCPQLQFLQQGGGKGKPAAIYQDSSRLKGFSVQIADLRENYGPIATPTGAFFLDGTLYQFYQNLPETRRNGEKCNPYLHLNAILSKSTGRYDDWSKASSLTFQKLYDVSQHQLVENCVKPEDTQAGDPGKFIFDAPVVLDQATMKSLNIVNALPESIRDARRVIFVFGSSWLYRLSNMYLAVIADRDIDKGPGSWWYLASMKNGAPEWKQGSTPAISNQSEIGAMPLLTTWSNRLNRPIIGEHSVRYIKELGGFLLLYGKPAAGGLFARTAKMPWGPWSSETLIFQSGGEWARRISKIGPDNQITQNWPQMFAGPKAPGPRKFDDGGTGPYGPNTVENKYTVNSDGSVTVYYTTSFFVPYQVFLMKATFKKQ